MRKAYPVKVWMLVAGGPTYPMEGEAKLSSGRRPCALVPPLYEAVEIAAAC
jgi:hypothetical protein